MEELNCWKFKTVASTVATVTIGYCEYRCFYVNI